MAQLRDAQTSALLAEGTPTEVVLIAEEVGRDRVLFDDVGAGFDPDAVLAAHREAVEADEAALKTLKGAVRDDVKAVHDERVSVEENAKAQAEEVGRALDG